MDVLTDVLRMVRLQSQCHGRLELSAPWGIEVIASGRPSSHFYVVSRGTAWLDLDDGGQPVRLSSGDLVLLPRGERHLLRDDPGTRAVPVEQIAAAHDPPFGDVIRYGGGGVLTSVLTGHFTFEGGLGDALVASLPPLIQVRSDGGGMARWLDATLQFLAAENDQAQPGAETVVSRLSDILFIQALRAWVPSGQASLPECSRGWLRALKDPQMATALRPGAPWADTSARSSPGRSKGWPTR
jgi:hypothetical protein